MKTLVWVEHDGSAVKDATLSAVTAASKLGEVHLLVAGQGVDGVAQAAAKIAGVQKVHVADDAAYAHALAENVAPLVVELMGHHDAFIAPSTTNGKAIAPRVAALLDVMQISDILSVEGEDTFTRPIYAGNAIATVQTTDAKKVITVRGTAFDKAAAEGGSGTVEAVASTGDKGLATFEGSEIAELSRPELTSAKIIVSGGRALGSGEKFTEVLERQVEAVMDDRSWSVPTGPATDAPVVDYSSEYIAHLRDVLPAGAATGLRRRRSAFRRWPDGLGHSRTRADGRARAAMDRWHRNLVAR